MRLFKRRNILRDREVFLDEFRAAVAVALPLWQESKNTGNREASARLDLLRPRLAELLEHSYRYADHGEIIGLRWDAKEILYLQ